MARGIIFLLIAALILEVLFCRWLAKRKWRPGTTRMTVAAGIAALVGPACAVLPYTDYLPARLGPDLAGAWLLAAIGAIGIGIGVFAFSTSSKVAGTICVLTNIPVLAYWGFIAGYVSMGGGR
jgi:ABC-type transport system involved in cytochrome c biogenesis permease subunit